MSPSTYWVGANDTEKRLFEGLWAIPEGISYNSYIIKGTEKTVLIDSVLGAYQEEHLEKIRKVTNPADIDYIVVNHMEHDHSEALPKVLEAAPKATLIYTPMAHQMYKAFFQKEPKNLIIIRNDETTVNLGGKTLRFIRTPFLHWPETICTYLQEEKTLFTCDLFGTFRRLPENKVIDTDIKELDRYFPSSSKKYFAGVMTRYRDYVLKTMEKFNQLKIEIKVIAPGHGPIYTAANVKQVMDLWASCSRPDYTRKTVIAVGSMYGTTLRFIQALTKGVEDAGGEAEVIDVINDEPAKALAAILDAPALIIGTATYEYNLFPQIQYLLYLLEVKNLTNLTVGVFGSYAWGAGGAKHLVERLDQLGFHRIGEAVEVRGAPTQEDLERARSLAKAVTENAFHEKGI
ncbi:MAG: FprA family A-type flavoprotein [Thaumarchaeota archaeon]|nr:FprA family A-type flavoprotein [Nitrososphaerota archaeon]